MPVTPKDHGVASVAILGLLRRFCCMVFVKYYLKHEEECFMRCFQTLRKNISNTRWSVSSDIQSLRSITSNTSSILSYIQTSTSHITNSRVFQENLANIQTPQEIILISNSRRNISSDIQHPPPPHFPQNLGINKGVFLKNLSSR